MATAPGRKGSRKRRSGVLSPPFLREERRRRPSVNYVLSRLVALALVLTASRQEFHALGLADRLSLV